IQVEYENEDPRIRILYESELAEEGIESRMAAYAPARCHAKHAASLGGGGGEGGRTSTAVRSTGTLRCATRLRNGPSRDGWLRPRYGVAGCRYFVTISSSGATSLCRTVRMINTAASFPRAARG